MGMFTKTLDYSPRSYHTGLTLSRFQPAANNPLTCVCPSPKTVCGLSCGAFSACQSGIPVVRRAADKAHIDMLPRTSRIGNKALCPSRKTPCGIPNKGFQAWECVDTESDLFSCGGCAMSGPFGQGMKRGRDCSTIEGTAAVRCEGGRCVVESCMGGYVPSKNVSACTMKGNEEEGALEGALRGGLKSIFGVGV
ncbi:hypothetical protein FA13DRAFT_1740900 [Coprinellus micaceus]|uniref:Protein CPL1-like domain-containing protein n=1 Tax=Coprinellus micaceus TaxID=71717 RepID=A0A4Y7SKS6_COPMI|nr:hypothetical protein FA13DRAFT_1740900 [Coprinellus micaceus]